MDVRVVKQIPVVFDANEEQFISDVYPLRQPVILRGLDIGSCCSKWNPEYLADVVGKDRSVTTHVTTTPTMDFLSKNFSYKSLSFSSFILRASSEVVTDCFFSENEKYYLRSIGSNPRKDVANVECDFPELMDDFRIPQLFSKSQFFSSVFRIASSNIQIWTHYDVMDNALIQIRGRKRVVLFSPADALNMYLKGDKSKVLNIDEPDLEAYPDFIKAKRHEGVLEPGDILFIPAMWFHNTLALNFNVAINVFWRHLDQRLHDLADVYGNRDLIPAARALEFVQRAVKLLNELPAEYRDFYGRRLVSEIQDKTFIKNTF